MSEIGYSAFDRYSPTFISSLQSTRGFIVVLWVLDDFTKVTTVILMLLLGETGGIAAILILDIATQP